MRGRQLQISDRNRLRATCFGAARVDAVVHGAPCLARSGSLSVLPRVEGDMSLHLRTRLTALRDLMAMRSLFANRQNLSMTFGLCAVCHQPFVMITD